MHADRTAATNQPTIALAGNVAMPALGFGTFQLEESVACDAVAHALKVGYRHVDTADMYGNHGGVGKAIAESDVPRDETFLVYEPLLLIAGIYLATTIVLTLLLRLVELNFPGMRPTRRRWLPIR